MTTQAPRKRSRALGCVQWLVVMLFLLPALLGVPAVIGYNWVDHQLHQPANPGNSKVRFVVEPGATFHEVADTLHRTGLIDSVTVFDLYARYKHLDTNVQAGAYELSRNLNMIQILTALQTAIPEEIFVPNSRGVHDQEDGGSARRGRRDQGQRLHGAGRAGKVQLRLPQGPTTRSVIGRVSLPRYLPGAPLRNGQRPDHPPARQLQASVDRRPPGSSRHARSSTLFR